MKSVQKKSGASAFTSDAGRPLWAKLSIAVCLVLGVYFGLKGLNASADAAKKPGADRQTASKKLHATPIEQITVGHRVLGQNPEVTDAERLDFIEPDADLWQTVRLRMTKSDGGRLDITLLRPNEWFELLDVKAGGTIDLDLPEMGAVGAADVLEIGPCPTIKSGNGNVVTGTFAHQSADVIDLRVSGQSAPIGCTSNHRFWSVDRAEFIEAGQLRVGEQLDTPNGLVSVVSLTPRTTPESVYNIEVLGEHVYRVGPGGILVHNLYPGIRFDSLNRVKSAFARITKADLYTGTATNAATRAAARAIGNAADDAGHLIGKLLGGPGGKKAMNWFAQNPAINRGAFRELEKKIAQEVAAGKDVFVRVRLIYDGASTRASKIIYQVRINGNTLTKVFFN